MGYTRVISYNPLTNHLLTSCDIRDRAMYQPWVTFPAKHPEARLHTAGPSHLQGIGGLIFRIGPKLNHDSVVNMTNLTVLYIRRYIRKKCICIFHATFNTSE